METARIESPRFRTDLVAQPIDEEGQRFVDVTDPDSGATFRFYDVEYSIACAMDGRRDIDGLIEYALIELGLEASPTELSTVVATLADLGYLATGEAAAAAPPLSDDMLDLGAAGGTPGEGGVPGLADLPAEPMELGEPGKSPMAGPRPEAPRAPALELGHAGVVDGPDAPEIEMVVEPDEPVRTGGEMSFAGLLDADEAPTAVRDASRSQVDADEVPTMVRGDVAGGAAPADAHGLAGAAEPVDDFGDLEGLTPPPAEVPEPSLRPVTDASADDDGPTNLPPPQVHEFDDEDVSVDLSQHLSIDTEDVKEAVRASQVMAAVEVPPELLAEMEESEAAATKAVATAATKDAPVAAIGKTPRVKGKEPEPTQLPDKQPEIKAAAASEAAEKAAAEAAPSSGGVSPVLWVLLIIAILGGAAAYYFLVYKKDTTGSKRQPGARVVKPNKPTPPPVPVKPTTKLALTAATSAVVNMPADSVVAWIAEADSDVEKGALVAKLRDFARYEGKLKNFQDRELYYQGKQDKAQARLEQAQASGNAANTNRFEAEVAKFKAKVEEKQRGVKSTIEAMKAATLTAPAAGTVEQIARVKSWVKAGDPVVKISTLPILHGVFTVAKNKSAEFVVGGRVEVGSKIAPDKMATCDVVEVDGVEVKVECPTGGALTRDLEVVLLKLVADEPEHDPDGEPEIDPEPEIEVDPADDQ